MKFDDCHAHTSLSYCAERGISPSDYVAAISSGKTLRSVAITNHGFAVYFPEDLAWSWRFMEEPSLFTERMAWGNERLIPHLEEVESLRDQGLRTGLEVEMMKGGRLTVDPALVDRLDVLIGSIHWLASEGGPSRQILAEWKRHVRALVRTGINVLGHPLRWLSNQVSPLPGEIVPFVVDAAQEAGVAIEVNSHYVVDADADLLLEAVRRGVPVAFATDSHRVGEIGDFSYHTALVAKLGLSWDELRLWAPPVRTRAGR
jgi:histidinol phosphatase-like PHP family hydrolase